MCQVRLPGLIFHQCSDFLPEKTVLDGAFIERKRDFLGLGILCKIGGQRLTKLMDQVIGAERSTCDILDVGPVAPPGRCPCDHARYFP